MSTVELHTVAVGVGTGPPVVLVPGMGTHSGSWAALMPQLADQFDVLAVDNRDVGRSPRATEPYTIEDMSDDVAAAIRGRWGHRKVGLVGQSLGSSISLVVASRHPALVGAVVAVAPPARGDEYLRRTFGAFRDLAESGDHREAFAVLALSLAMDREVFDRQPEVIEAMLNTMDADPTPLEPDSYRRQLDALLAFDIDAHLSRITAPTRVIAGVRDRLAPPDHTVRISQGITGAELVLLANAAHGIGAELPTAYVDLVRGHLRRQLTEVR